MDEIYNVILRWPAVVLLVAGVALFISRRQKKLAFPLVEPRNGKKGSDTLMEARVQVGPVSLPLLPHKTQESDM